MQPLKSFYQHHPKRYAGRKKELRTMERSAQTEARHRRVGKNTANVNTKKLGRNPRLNNQLYKKLT